MNISSSLPSVLPTSSASTSNVRDAGREKMEAGMEKFLQSKGLGVEERDSLKADLKSAFESNVQSGSNPPDFETMQSTVKAVFEKHGLNADDVRFTVPSILRYLFA